MALTGKLLKYFCLILSIFFLGRVALFVTYFPRFNDADVNYWLSFIYGARMDIMATSVLMVIPALLLTTAPRIASRIVDLVLKVYFLVVFAFIINLEFATFPFMAQFDVRPNYLFVEYLEFPREVFSMLFTAYKLEIFMGLLAIAAFIFIYLKYGKPSFRDVLEVRYTRRLALLLPVLVLLFLGIRSSFGHRPANISDAMYSSNRLVNEITKNSLYSVGYAIYNEQKHGSAKVIKQYGKMDTEEALDRVRKRLHMQETAENTHGPDHPLCRLQSSHFHTDNPKNLVILIEESLGSQFSEAFGGETGITPNLDALSTEGIKFSNLYSNGTRSVRGIAGLVSGIYAVPGKGVVKRNKSQQDFFTLASLLKPLGYHTSFIYGGESRFDNMRGWFLGNGFDEIIDQPTFKDPSYVGTWGVCDEDLLVRAHKTFTELHAQHRKFASVVFTTSNHTPFDFPEKKIQLVNGVPEKSVENAIKYADYAIGRFIELAREEDYYKDTVFVIVADHNVRVYGDDMVPVNMFHIPAILLGGGIEPRIYDRIASQPDVLATALDLMGLDVTDPIMGNSIFSENAECAVLMQFNDTYALRAADHVAVLQPSKDPLTFRYADNRLAPVQHDRELEKDALAMVLTLNHLYEDRLYQ